MRFATLLAASATLAFATTAAAQDSGAYAGVSIDSLEFDAYAISARAGYNFNDYFGVEGQAGFGIIDDEEPVDGGEIKTGIDSLFGAFGVLRTPVGESVDLFARGGYYFAQLGVEDEDGDFSEDADIDGFAFGLGGQFNFGEGAMNGIRLEYTYLDVDTIEVDGIDVDADANGDLFSVSYIRKF